ncbi:uncharacterized protein LOC143452921 [Clavelina lepadiformis]|uniref:uncharacterized protein LOC143452921 n=1 Tax=Clavelina lepadiformis TaxID=159417 RepID=UPI0040417779
MLKSKKLQHKNMDALFSMILVGLFVYANLATAKQCKGNGALNIGPFHSSSASLVVNFPSAVSFSNVPYVFVWARGRSKHNGLFRAQVTSIDLFRFNVTVNRYDTLSRDWITSLTLHWEVQIECSMVKSVQGNSAEHNRRRYNATAFIMKRVNFPSSVRYTRVPMVYAWVRVKGRRDNNYIAKVTTVDLMGFDVIITKVRLNRGPWDSSLSLQWKIRDMPSMTVVPPPPLLGLRQGQITFYQRYEHILEIYAWARSPTNLIPRKRYKVNIRSASNTGFTFTIRNLNPFDFNENHSLHLHWSVHQKANSEYVTKMVGHGNYSSIVDIPPSTWLTTPTITETSENVFDIFGRDIHFSIVRQMLHEATDRIFPVNKTTESEAPFEVALRGDCIYLDQNVTLQGLKKLTIHARKFVSNGSYLTLKAPQICEQIEGSRCLYLGKAETSLDGANGKHGIASPLVQVYVKQTVGNVNFRTEATDGIVGEGGGNGAAGQVGPTARNIPVGDTTPHRYLKNCVIVKGLPGLRGGNGVDGAKAGLPGKGGISKRVILITQYIAGLIRLTQRPGKGGSPAEHGYGGDRGYGGEGGCGRGCRKACEDVSKWGTRYECTVPFPDCSDSSHGVAGPPGDAGLDGFNIYPVQKHGADGIVEKPILRQVGNLKEWFVSDTELLNLIRRRGELLFQRNNKEEALDIFSFLASVTNVGSTLNQQASWRQTLLERGLDYYGNNEIYAPNLSWNYLKTRLNELLVAGRTYEMAYDNVKDKIDNMMFVKEVMEDAVKVDLTKSQRELRHKRMALATEKSLYVKSVRQVEKMMVEEQREIKNLTVHVIIEKNEEDSRRIGNIFLDLISVFFGFVTSPIAKNPQLAYDSFIRIFQKFDSAQGCSTPTLDEAKSTLQTRLNFAAAYGKMKNIDFSTMDVSAVPEIMRSKLGKNRGKLLLELGCLFDREHKSKMVKSLETVLDDFFRDGDLRITLINKIIDLEVQLKEISHKLDVATQWKSDMDNALHSTIDDIPMSVKRKFTELVFSLYQEHEIMITRSLYELAKAYQFMSLWKFDALVNYDNVYGDLPFISNLGSLNGMFHFEQIKQRLESERNRFLNAISTTSGAGSHTYTLLREFDYATYPKLFALLRKKGRFVVHLDLDPSNAATTGCVSCYNARLISIYVEVNGSAQPPTVSSRIYVKVAHMGDSYFLLPLSDGNTTVVRYQQKPENIAGGHVVYFNKNQLVTSILDPSLNEKFEQSEGNRFCHDYTRAQDFFGGQLCKSPYATYTITVPRRRRLQCHRHVSGTNCRDLDFTRFENVRIFMKIRAWSDYPSPPN